MRRFRAFAFTAPGLERLLYKEMESICGKENVSLTKEGCEIARISDEGIWKVCSSSRLASGLRIRIGPTKVTNKFPVLNHHIRTLPWQAFLPLKLPSVCKVQTTCHSSKLFHSDAVSERIRHYLEKRKWIRTEEQEAKDSSKEKICLFGVHARVVDDKTQISIDAGGDMLSRRGYRTQVTEAPIRENLAAACLDAMEYKGEPLWDPFCGSGTLLCEALLRYIASENVLAFNQLTKSRRHFAFEQWASFPDQAFIKWKEGYVDGSRDFFQEFLRKPPHSFHFVASDISRIAIQAATHNWNNLINDCYMDKESSIHFNRGDFEKLAPEVLSSFKEPPILFCNLPYGVRLGDHLNSIYNRLNKLIDRDEDKFRDVFVIDGSADNHFLSIASSHKVQWKQLLQFSNGGTPVRLLKQIKKKKENQKEVELLPYGWFLFLLLSSSLLYLTLNVKDDIIACLGLDPTADVDMILSHIKKLQIDKENSLLEEEEVSSTKDTDNIQEDQHIKDLLEEKEQILSDLLKKVQTIQEDIKQIDMSLKVLTEKKEEQIDGSEESLMIQNQLFLILMEKNETMSQFVQSLHFKLTSGTSRIEENNAVIPQPPPLPISGFLFSLSPTHAIYLRGKLENPFAQESLKNQFTKLVKGVGLNTVRKLDLSFVRLSRDQILQLADALLSSDTVTYVNLSNMGLRNSAIHAIANAIKESGCITSLDVSFNSFSQGGFGAISEMLRSNNSIESFNVNGNPLTDQNVQCFASALGEAKMLSHLFCSGCSISSIGFSLICEGLSKPDSVVHMDVSRNNVTGSTLSSAAEWLECTASLEYLNLSQNNIGPEGIVTLAPAIQECKTLKTLLLSQTSLSGDGISAMAAIFTENDVIEEIDLSKNKLSKKETSAVLQGLKFGCSITSLNLWGNHLTADSLQSLDFILTFNDHMKKLQLRGTRIGPFLHSLSQGIRSTKSLKVLDLTATTISSSAILSLVEQLKLNVSIEELYLSGNSIGDHGAAAIATILPDNQILRILDLKLNCISDVGCKKLAKGVAENNSLLSLDVSLNHIGVEGFRELGAVLMSNKSITTLSMHGNESGGEAVRELVKGIVKNATLTDIDLSSNRMRREASHAISDLLRSPVPRITSLHLNKNGMTDKEIIGICSALKNNPILKEISLEGNFCRQDGASAISELTQMNSFIETISLLNNGFSSETHQILEEAVARSLRVFIKH